MDIGMLWFDDDGKRNTAEKIKRAAEYYKAKYGREPVVCYVHPDLLDNGKEGQVGLIRIIGSRTVIKNHFWLGVDDAKAHR